MAYDDGALAIENGKIVECGDYSSVAKAHPGAAVRDLRGGYILPGFIDTHIHFPQIRILGGLGYGLLDWLEQLTLPEEARLADAAYASCIAQEFVAALAAHGTTTALVFGSHFAGATAALFTAAEQRGLRVFSGLVLSDRLLRPELLQTPDARVSGCQNADRSASVPAVRMRSRRVSHVRLRRQCCRYARLSSPKMQACGLPRTSTRTPKRSMQIARLFPWAPRLPRRLRALRSR